MSIIARIAAVFALSLSLPKIMGIGPSIITPPAFISGFNFSYRRFPHDDGLLEFGVFSKSASLPNGSVLFE